MVEYRDGTRIGTDTNMKAAMHGVTDAEIAALAHDLAQRDSSAADRRLSVAGWSNVGVDLGASRRPGRVAPGPGRPGERERRLLPWRVARFAVHRTPGSRLRPATTPSRVSDAMRQRDTKCCRANGLYLRRWAPRNSRGSPPAGAWRLRSMATDPPRPAYSRRRRVRMKSGWLVSCSKVTSTRWRVASSAGSRSRCSARSASSISP